MLKSIIILLMLLGSFFAKAQFVDPYHNWHFSFGRSGTPGDIIKVGLEYGMAEKSTINTEIGYEASRTKNLKYKSYGLSVAYRYYILGNTLMTSKSKTNIAIGLGGIIQLDSEPTVYKSLPMTQRLNYGVSGQIMGEYFFDPVIGFFIQAEQRVMSRELLGRYNYFIGAGLKIHFGNQY